MTRLNIFKLNAATPIERIKNNIELWEYSIRRHEPHQFEPVTPQQFIAVYAIWETIDVMNRQQAIGRDLYVKMHHAMNNKLYERFTPKQLVHLNEVVAVLATMGEFSKPYLDIMQPYVDTLNTLYSGA